MPELPEVEVVRRSLAARLVGRRVESAEVSGLALRCPLDVTAWRRWSLGRTVRDLDRRGKYLVALADDAAFVFHLGMSGRLVLARSGSARPVHTHLALTLDDGSELRFIDPRRFGLAVPMAAESVRTYQPLATLGLDPLLEDCVPALRSVRQSRVAIRNVLLDQSVVAGVGNIYANEALFRAGTHPATPARKIADRRILRLASALKEVLADAVSAGGTTLADGGFANADGEAGYFAVNLAVYGRAGLPCARCGREIRRFALGGRSAYFCATCQRR